jgi:phosphoribosylformimino-5-aminoimidazole carboxamide ribotide isomerase
VKVYPAIDLLDGKAVRLLEGRRDQVTVFHDEPWQLVRDMADAGADRIHVVDLGGAFSGAPEHREIVRRIIAASPVPVQVGGGLRDRAALEAVFDAGAGFAVLGTAAVKTPALVEEVCRSFPGRIIVAVDARNGMVAVEGWVEATSVFAEELAVRAADWGAAGVLYTDVARDGTGVGPNVTATAELVRAVAGRCDVIASGGVSSLDDVRRLAAAGIPAVVIGRALYDQKFSVVEAVEAARAG